MAIRKELVFAGAPYSNSAPLVARLEATDPRVRVVNNHPSFLVQELLEGRVDVALLPVVHLFRHPELMMLSGLGVVADGPVRSVLLQCRVPLEQVGTVERDPASATSNALAELLLRDHFNCAPAWVAPEEGVQADARVVIGDRALCAEPAPGGDVDLAGAWKAMTGLPFVFAVWAVRKDFTAMEAASTIAHKAYESGLRFLEKIAARYARELGGDLRFWLDYLSISIRYELGARELQGMTEFRRRLDRVACSVVDA